MNKISVIVPVYNTEKYLKQCLDSIQNQTFKDFEVIVIDDGSTDNSPSILKKYEKDSRFKIYHKVNGGQATARNLGLKYAKGEYVTFIDSDDYVKESMLEVLYDEASLKKADIVTSDIIKVKMDNEFPFKNHWHVKKEENKNYMTSHPGPVARLYKRDLFIQNKIHFKEGVIYEDLATMPILGLYAKKVIYINNGYYYYRIHEGSTMKQKKYNKKIEDIFLVMDSLEKEIKKRSNDDFIDEMEYLYVEHLLYSASLRFLPHQEKEKLKKISSIIKEKYPKFYKNIYFKKKSIKFKVVCFLFYHKRYKLLSILMKGKRDL